MTRFRWGVGIVLGLLLLSVLGCGGGSSGQADSLLHVSFDPTRELFDEYNETFVRNYEKTTGKKVKIQQSHGGSGKQARSVIDGLQSDLVTLALPYDVSAIAQAKLVSSSWQQQFPRDSVPYTSVIVLVVRKGNPQNIRDWDDLVRNEVNVITPNPKTSGGARWNYLAAYGYALKRYGQDAEQAKSFMKQLFARVQVLDAGARGSTTTFVERNIGDVLIAWESEAMLIKQKYGEQYELIYPSQSILAKLPVALIDSVVDRRGTRALAKAYVEGLYAEEGQRLIAKHFFRPTVEAVMKEYRAQFPDVPVLDVDEHFGGWETAHNTHFADGGLFDQITQK